MTKEQFEEQVVALMDTMYRISSSLLPRRQDQYDAVQSCLLRAFERRDGLRDEGRFRPWLLRILVNECHTVHRQNRRLVYADAPEQAGEAMPDIALRDAVRSLPEKYRVPVMLHYIEGFSVVEAAEVLKVPTGTIKTRMRKGRELLRGMIGEEE